MNTHPTYLGSRAHLISYYLSGLGEIAYPFPQPASESYIGKKDQMEK